MKLTVIGAGLAATAAAASAIVNHQDIPLGISWPASATHAKRQNDKLPIDIVPKLPILNLGYQKFQASKYSFKSDVYKWKNVRFAASTAGKSRWRKADEPPVDMTLATGKGNQCYNAPIEVFTSKAIREPNQLVSKAMGYVSPLFQRGSEDCLFLDISVPGTVVRKADVNSKLPVVVWFYGGAYIIGSKDIYDGTAIIEAAKGNAIFVAPNYRLGAFGWLGGPTVEKEGLVNAGLHDQRSALEWVQKYIHLVGGDKDQVSAWGESAGGGSLMHHLVLKGGTVDPLFKKAILMSPAFTTTWDTAGSVENSAQRFLSLIGCEGKGLECARSVDVETLHYANNITNIEAPAGSFAYGPVPDGQWIKSLPAVEISRGNYFKDLDSLIVSHVVDEAYIFVPPGVDTEDQVDAFIKAFTPSGVYRPESIDMLQKLYPSTSTAEGKALFSKPVNRVNAVVRDSTFTCNARWLAAAYPGRTWNMQYAGKPGIHGIDLIPTFINLKFPMWLSHRSYFASHAISGDPNTHRYMGGSPPSIEWPKARVEEVVQNVLNFKNDGYGIIEDKMTKKPNCDFWQGLQEEGTAIAASHAAGVPAGVHVSA